jgi:hypothetical protein
MLRCKLCNQQIKLPDEALVIGLSEEKRIAIIANTLAKHMSEQGAKESQAQHQAMTRQKNGNPAAMIPPAPHAQLVQSCVQQGAVMGQLVQGLLTLRAFHLTQELEKYAETHRANLHAWSRKVRMSDDDLSSLMVSFGLEQPTIPTQYSRLLRDLRDRYEELGKYAPATPQAEEAKI